MQRPVYRATIGNLEHSLPLFLCEVADKHQLALELVDTPFRALAVFTVFGVNFAVPDADRGRIEAYLLV